MLGDVKQQEPEQHGEEKHNDEPEPRMGTGPLDRVADAQHDPMLPPPVHA